MLPHIKLSTLVPILLLTLVASAAQAAKVRTKLCLLPMPGIDECGNVDCCLQGRGLGKLVFNCRTCQLSVIVRGCVPNLSYRKFHCKNCGILECFLHSGPNSPGDNYKQSEGENGYGDGMQLICDEYRVTAHGLACYTAKAICASESWSL
jgi:hypothetical protein